MWQRDLNIIESIRAEYNTLSKGQKLIGDYIMKNPERLCFLTLKDFSAELNTTPVSVLRFAQKLGVDNYVGLKREVQVYISQRLTPGEKFVSVIGNKVTTDAAFIQEVFQSDLENIRKTYDMLKPEDILRAVEILKKSKRVYIAAHNISKTLSIFLFSRLNSISIDTQYFDVDSTITMNTRLTYVKPTDAFVIASFSRYAQQVLFLADQLHKRDIPIICITDRLVSELADCATVTFACATTTPIFFNSYSAPMVVANILTSLVAMQMEDRLRALQGEVSALDQAFKAYIQDAAQTTISYLNPIL